MTTAVRGCGSRVAGGVYAETHLSERGLPIESFLVDPPRPVDNPENIGLKPIGVTLVTDPSTGVTHIYDWVGRQHYPNVADFIEEAARLGVSRRLPVGLAYERLSSQSKLILLHSRGWINEWAQYPRGTARDCPLVLAGLSMEDTHEGARLNEMCARLWWDDLEGVEPLTPDLMEGAGPRVCQRRMPSFSYQGHRPPSGLERSYKLAYVAVFPIHNLALIRDKETSSHLETIKLLKRARLEISMEDE